jgi:predicted metalloenzyme YecM
MAELGYKAPEVKIVANTNNNTNDNRSFTIAISARTKILSLALINPRIILIITLNKLCVSLYFCWCVA